MLSDSSRRLARQVPRLGQGHSDWSPPSGPCSPSTIVAAVGGTTSSATASPAAGSTLNWALAAFPPGLFTPSLLQHRLRDRVRERLHADPRRRRRSASRRPARAPQSSRGRRSTRPPTCTRSSPGQVLERIPDDGRGRRVLDQHPPQQEARFDDDALLRQRQVRRGQGQYRHGQLSKPNSNWPRPRREPGPRLLAKPTT